MAVQLSEKTFVVKGHDECFARAKGLIGKFNLPGTSGTLSLSLSVFLLLPVWHLSQNRWALNRGDPTPSPPISILWGSRYIRHAMKVNRKLHSSYIVSWTTLQYRRWNGLRYFLHATPSECPLHTKGRLSHSNCLRVCCKKEEYTIRLEKAWQDLSIQKVNKESVKEETKEHRSSCKFPAPKAEQFMM